MPANDDPTKSGYMQDQPFTLGVNYWPRRKAMYWCSQFEADEVREEYSATFPGFSHLIPYTGTQNPRSML
jgi:hypothetical protein